MTIFSTIIDMDVLTLSNIIYVLITSTVLGVVLSSVFVFTHKKTVYDHSFSVTLLLLPLVISIIIMLVSNNLARAFSLAGVFALVRFRTAIADSRDITYILSAVGIGLASAMGYLGYALVITVFIAFVLLFLYVFQIDADHTNHAKLKIVIPENLNYANAFDDIFKEHLMSHQLQRVKTTDFGTMFELTYIIKMKGSIDQKKFLDALRVRNGNLSITLTSDYVSLTSDI
ncbi:MAG: DUF4956 domain-containing protein [Firmicutes bacterium]|nr:DUF4956 domain-containing protein [Bacillota bacterium]